MNLPRPTGSGASEFNLNINPKHGDTASMQIEKISLTEANAFSSFFLDYMDQKELLRPFYQRFPSIENFKEQISEKAARYDSSSRSIFHKAITDQYKNFEIPKAVEVNLRKLSSEKTFTVTTGHQLNLCTGPLYVIYKIITTINTCKELKKKYPAYEFVPAYWMASEDHDFAEINHFRYQGNTITWLSEQAGAVGRFNLDGLQEVLSGLPDEASLFREAYLKHKSLRDAVRYYMTALFGNAGLLVVDGDDHSLKNLFKLVIGDDLLKNIPYKIINSTSERLEHAGYKPQVHARPINLFYLDDGVRERIESSGDHYTVVNTTTSFNKEKLQALLDSDPQKFSPNVVLRPLYQEMIMPNLAYIGGPSELLYWLQLKDLFTHYNVPFPVLTPRNFALLVQAPIEQKIVKAGLTVRDLFLPKDALISRYTLTNTDHKIELNGEKAAIEKYFQVVREQAEKVDKSLGPFVGAEAHKTMKTLEKIEEKMLKAEKRAMSEKTAQIESIKEKLFPGDGLQERSDNFLNFYLSDSSLLSDLIDQLDPFDFRLNIAVI